MRQFFRRISRLSSVKMRLVLFSVVAPNNSLFFLALVIFGVLGIASYGFLPVFIQWLF